MNNSSDLIGEDDGSLGMTSIHQDREFLRHNIEWTLLFIVAYTMVFIVGIVGNSCVVLVILRTRSMRTVTNLFILNLAVADLLVIIFCIPPTLLSNIIIRKFR